MPSERTDDASDVTEPKRHGPLRFAILSLLAIRPMSGYDVKRTYQRSMQRIWYAPIGQVYPTLRVMEREGLLKSSLHIQEGKPNRKEYQLSETGRTMLQRWLTQPAELPQMHHEFLHKMFLLDQMAPAEQLEFIEGYIASCEAWAQQLADVDEKFSSTPHGDYAEAAYSQLLSLRHLRRLVDCEIASARDILDDRRRHTRRRAPKKSSGHGDGARTSLTDIGLTPRAGRGNG